jgi:hypothetical protein
MVLLLGGIYGVCGGDGLKRYDIHTKFHED